MNKIHKINIVKLFNKNIVRFNSTKLFNIETLNDVTLLNKIYNKNESCDKYNIKNQNKYNVKKQNKCNVKNKITSNNNKNMNVNLYLSDKLIG